MNTRKAMFVALMSAALSLAAVSVQAETRMFGAQMAGSEVKIDGDSTIHKWTMTGKIIGGIMEVDEKFPIGGTAAVGDKLAVRVVASIPVRSIKSSYTTMDNVYQDAMKAKDFGKIEYKLTELKYTEAPKAAGGAYKFDSVGELTVAGVTNKITMPVTMESADGKAVMAKCSTKFKMTTFNVAPPCPKLAMGAIKTDDEVTITIAWALKLKDK